MLRAATTRESNGDGGAPAPWHARTKRQSWNAMPGSLRAANRCEITSVALAVENSSVDMREHAQTTPDIMRSAGI